jgi:hypothetical protein
MTNIDKSIKPELYQQFLSEVIRLVQKHRVVAVQSVQRLSNQLYWNIGEIILQKQKEFGWGKSVVEKLSKDLNRHLGDAVSWSPRNLRLMRQMVDEYSNVKQLVSHLENMKQPVSEIQNLNQPDSDLELPSAEEFKQILINND